MDKVIGDLLMLNIMLLASSPESQREYLRKEGSYPSLDELAIGFDDIYPSLKDQDNVLIPKTIRAKLDKLDSTLNLLSDSVDKNVWHESALDTEPWIEVRNIAASIIDEINQ